jgi:two-component system sensor histidine kinase KdpD
VPGVNGVAPLQALASCDTDGRVLDLAVGEDLPLNATDANLLTRAVAIVVDNACRFSPENRPVRITEGVAGDTIELLVIDQGPEIPRAKREAVLEPLQRSTNGETSANLGLSVASQFVQLLGAELRRRTLRAGD